VEWPVLASAGERGTRPRLGWDGLCSSLASTSPGSPPGACFDATASAWNKALHALASDDEQERRSRRLLLDATGSLRARPLDVRLAFA
jgi:hypothetical protein